MMLTWRSAASAAPWRWLSRLWGSRAEPIELAAQSFGYLPARFRHHGEVHRIARVERSWEQPSRGMRAARRYFAVRCARAGRCTLFQDLGAGTWHVLW